jgi:hypothetical protein
MITSPLFVSVVFLSIPALLAYPARRKASSFAAAYFAMLAMECAVLAFFYFRLHPHFFDRWV